MSQYQSDGFNKLVSRTSRNLLHEELKLLSSQRVKYIFKMSFERNFGDDIAHSSFGHLWLRGLSVNQKMDGSIPGQDTQPRIAPFGCSTSV